MENRLRQVRQQLNLTQEFLALQLGLGKSAISMIETGRASLSERNKNTIVQLLNINPDWLETGNGEMFAQPSNLPIPHSTASQGVPLYSIGDVRTLASLFKRKKHYPPIDYIQIPQLPQCDGALQVVCENMYPLLNSGDIVMYKQLVGVEDIFFGEMYLLSLELHGQEFIMVKYIHKSTLPNHLKLVNHNPHYPDQDVETTSIRAIALVKTTIRMHSIR